METNQQPNALHLAQELKAGEWSPNILQNEVALRQCAADELRRLHAENEALSNKLQTFEALGGAVDDLQLLRMGYAAARLEIASLKVRAADARHDIDDLTARDESQRLRIAELEAQLAAIGAGGVEPLRKRECLHHVAEPAPSEWDVRGHLAESLTCWCRLTGQEAAELVELFQGRPVQADAPVVLPAPDAVLRFERSTAGKENEMPIVVSCNWLPDGEYKLYTEQQVRAMLAAAPKPPAHEPGQHGSAYPAHGITAAPNGGDHGR